VSFTLEHPIATATVGDLMQHPELQISDDAMADTAMDVLLSSGVDHLLVRDEDGRCAGLLTRLHLAPFQARSWYTERTPVRDILHDRAPFATADMPAASTHGRSSTATATPSACSPRRTASPNHRSLRRGDRPPTHSGSAAACGSWSPHLFMWGSRDARRGPGAIAAPGPRRGTSPSTGPGPVLVSATPRGRRTAGIAYA
jgi:hypothetical protein